MLRARLAIAAILALSATVASVQPASADGWSSYSKASNAGSIVQTRHNMTNGGGYSAAQEVSANDAFLDSWNANQYSDTNTYTAFHPPGKVACLFHLFCV